MRSEDGNLWQEGFTRRVVQSMRTAADPHPTAYVRSSRDEVFHAGKIAREVDVLKTFLD